jgi:tRNA A-37 threonylcarbamoyl transferase component Bud32
MIFRVLVKPSVTLRYLALANTLKAIGIRTPSIIAIVEEKSFFGTKRSFVLTEWIRNAMTLKEYIIAAPSRPRSGSESAERRAIIHCFAEMVRRLHSNKIFHFDLSLLNILLSDERSGTHSLTLVDLDAAVISRQRAGILSSLLRFADLLILNKDFYPVTHLKERLRFLAAYSGKTVSMRRYRRTLFFLVSTPALLHVCRGLEAIRLIHLLRRLLICLRIVR